MRFIVNGTEKNTSLKMWNNDRSEWEHAGVDEFDELALDDIRTDSDFTWDDEKDAYTCTEQAYRGLIEWWQGEVDRYNKRETNWFTEACDEAAEFAKNLEWVFDAD